MSFYQFCLILVSVLTPAAAVRSAVIDFQEEGHGNQANAVRERFLELTRALYEEGMQRVKRLNHMRLKYEENPYYELGYVVGELIEKYRKQVELVKFMHDFKAEILFRRIAQLQMIMNVYFETYHFYNMFHEIPRKYAYIPEFKEVSVKFDSYIDALDQTCDEYDSKCRTETQMGDVFKSITEERELELINKKQFRTLLKKYREKFLQAYVDGTLEQLKNESFAGMYDPMYKPPGHIAQGESVYNIYANNDKILNQLGRLQNTSLFKDYYHKLGIELKKKYDNYNENGSDFLSIFANPYFKEKIAAMKNITKPKPFTEDYFLPLDDIYWKKQHGPGNLIGVKRPNRPKQRRPHPVEYGWSNEDVFFQGWDENEPDENTTFIYSQYKPPAPVITTTKKVRRKKNTTTNSAAATTKP